MTGMLREREYQRALAGSPPLQSTKESAEASGVGGGQVATLRDQTAAVRPTWRAAGLHRRASPLRSLDPQAARDPRAEVGIHPHPVGPHRTLLDAALDTIASGGQRYCPPDGRDRSASSPGARACPAG